jgi:2-keto-4-pentenoate hydratase/2-oxohepta-3-ene-1,7-dioic acid hydratase in catechol pathway
VALADLPGLESLSFTLDKNGHRVQTGQFSGMVFKPASLLSYVKSHYPVVANDVLLTGTPEGVGPLKSGDLLEARLYSENREILTCHWDVI